MSVLDDAVAAAARGPVDAAAALSLAAAFAAAPHDHGDDRGQGHLDALADELTAAAGARRDARWGRTAWFSPKVFLPVTNLCKNACDYCSFRRSPGQAGEWTMRPDEIESWLGRGRELGCVEALLCLGDSPERVFAGYRQTLAEWGHGSTVEYLVWACERALDMGLLPHTNAGILSAEEMRRLAPVNASLGLMLESASERLCQRGMPHHRAPDKRPAVRLAMIDQAGALGIPFTTGILVGIGETEVERVEALLAIRDLHRRHGHIQEVIVQSFRARPDVPMSAAPEPGERELLRAIALARVILDDEVAVQVPPNLTPGSVKAMLAAGVSDFGGISPLTPDYISPGYPWPHLDQLAAACARAGFSLTPRPPVHAGFLDRPGFVPAVMQAHIRAAAPRLDHLAATLHAAAETQP
ncbi:7,8-didemethyl-8-hydroxy-5-deazariboflavin synthase CofG [Haliangium sp.]|uniref:7,8-didemethyl-8-hydroxy-5-deazariboflavin synthase CofG n=1 Tax=Haliangium sp. TaxID=2663208 RepID=UPI003D107F13